MKLESLFIREGIGPDGLYAKPSVCLDVESNPNYQGPHEEIELGRAMSVLMCDEHDTPKVQGKKHSFLADLNVIDGNGAAGVNRYCPGKPWVEVDRVESMLYDNTIIRLEAKYQWYIPLDRARREIARHFPDWELVVDDGAAFHGLVRWRPRMRRPRCRANIGPVGRGHSPFCNDLAVTEVSHRDWYIPLCELHQEKLQRKIVQDRGGRSK